VLALLLLLLLLVVLVVMALFEMWPACPGSIQYISTTPSRGTVLLLQPERQSAWLAAHRESHDGDVIAGEDCDDAADSKVQQEQQPSVAFAAPRDVQRLQAGIRHTLHMHKLD
jgi:hypothetical protein